MRKDVSGYIYFVECDGWIKIGKTEGSVEKRIKQLQTGSPHEIKLVKSFRVENYLDIVEMALHEQFQNKRARGEWFFLSFEEWVLAFVNLNDNTYSKENIIKFSKENGIPLTEDEL